MPLLLQFSAPKRKNSPRHSDRGRKSGFKGSRNSGQGTPIPAGLLMFVHDTGHFLCKFLFLWRGGCPVDIEFPADKEKELVKIIPVRRFRSEIPGCLDPTERRDGQTGEEPLSGLHSFRKDATIRYSKPPPPDVFPAE